MTAVVPSLRGGKELLAYELRIADLVGHDHEQCCGPNARRAQPGATVKFPSTRKLNRKSLEFLSGIHQPNSKWQVVSSDVSSAFI
jgi:hypothetical protein